MMQLIHDLDLELFSPVATHNYFIEWEKNCQLNIER